MKISKTEENNFRIASADRVFYPAKVKIQGNTLQISSPKVKHPQAVRYAFTNTSEATFFNGAGLPASSFRTDTWDIITSNTTLQPIFDTVTKTLMYQLSTTARETDIYYDFNEVPGKSSKRYLSPFSLMKTGTLYAVVARDGYLSEIVKSWEMTSNKAAAADVIYKFPYSDYYPAGGKLALVDGILASKDTQAGNWQGFEGNDMDIIIDLGKTTSFKSVKCNFQSDNNNWIFLPKKVTVEVSEDGVTYRKLGESGFSCEKEVKISDIQAVTFYGKGNIKYVKLTAINQGTCPAWHPGAGNKCWLFADEIVVN